MMEWIKNISVCRYKFLNKVMKMMINAVWTLSLLGFGL